MKKRGFHPRAWLRTILTYPRFMGEIKPNLLRSGLRERAAHILSQDIFWQATTLQVPIGKRLLVLCPHPDDEAIGCGGLLLLHRGKSTMQIVNVFNGDGGGNLTSDGTCPPKERRSRLALERGREIELVAETLGATLLRFGVSEYNDNLGTPHVSELRKIIADFKPDIILLPWFLDGHKHHRAVNKLFARAAVGCSALVVSYEIWSLLQPNAILDISSVINEKLGLISVYRTQLSEIDYISYAKSLARVRAVQKGADKTREKGFAECFFVLPSADYCDIVNSIDVEE